MYLARFFYDLLPVDRDRAVDFTTRREAEAARAKGLNACLLMPPTRGEGGAALPIEVEMTSPGQLERLRHRGVGGGPGEEDAGD